MKAKYKHISLPDKLIEEVDRYKTEHPELDFRSRSQVVIFALRKLFTEKKQE